jgi:hypothetical protein
MGCTRPRLALSRPVAQLRGRNVVTPNGGMDGTAGWRACARVRAVPPGSLAVAADAAQTAFGLQPREGATGGDPAFFITVLLAFISLFFLFLMGRNRRRDHAAVEKRGPQPEAPRRGDDGLH